MNRTRRILLYIGTVWAVLSSPALMTGFLLDSIPLIATTAFALGWGLGLVFCVLLLDINDYKEERNVRNFALEDAANLVDRGSDTFSCCQGNCRIANEIRNLKN